MDVNGDAAAQPTKRRPGRKKGGKNVRPNIYSPRCICWACRRLPDCALRNPKRTPTGQRPFTQSRLSKGALTVITIDYFSVVEAASVLGVTPFTVRKRIKQGKLEAVKVCGQWRIPSRALRGEKLNE